jgi:hypothetical protein
MPDCFNERLSVTNAGLICRISGAGQRDCYEVLKKRGNLAGQLIVAQF